MFFMLTAKVYAWLCQMGIWRSITRSNASVLITTKVICNIVSLKRQWDKDCGSIVDYKLDEGLKSISQVGVEKRRWQTASGVQSLAYCIKAYALGAGSARQLEAYILQLKVATMAAAPCKEDDSCPAHLTFLEFFKLKRSRFVK